MASSYERELRAVLAGSPDGVRAVTRSCTELERAKAMQVVQRPFLVVRAAGSGMDGSGSSTIRMESYIQMLALLAISVNQKISDTPQF